MDDEGSVMIGLAFAFLLLGCIAGGVITHFAWKDYAITSGAAEYVMRDAYGSTKWQWKKVVEAKKEVKP